MCVGGSPLFCVVILCTHQTLLKGKVCVCVDRGWQSSESRKSGLETSLPLFCLKLNMCKGCPDPVCLFCFVDQHVRNLV